MTHPTGPAGSGPSGGAGTGPKFLSAFLSALRLTRARSEAAAVKAGACSVSARPLSKAKREDNYAAQNGTARQTPRQRRRAEHKANLAVKRGTAA